MLIKILFTIAVIIAVAIFYRTKSPVRKPAPEKPQDDGVSLSVRTVAYTMLAVLILLSATIFFFKYQSDNQILSIHVIAEDGTKTTYQARQKNIKGRQFTTLDEKQVTLGESDRFEIEEN